MNEHLKRTVSIITVCFNAAEDLEKTIRSVLCQKNCEIEYIIKDGASTDNTAEMVRQYEPQLRKLKNFVFLSEKDTGLYDAMNIATKIAKEDYVQFLNSGDTLVDSDTIAFVERGDFDGDLLYGDMIQVCEGRQMLQKASPDTIENFPKNITFSHQALFTRTTVMQELLYDTRYPICADYEFFQRAYACGKRFRYMNRPICFFQLGGISYQKAFDLLDETYDIQRTYGVITEREYRSAKRNNHWKRISRRLIPAGWYARAKAWKQRKSTKNWTAVQHMQDDNSTHDQKGIG